MRQTATAEVRFDESKAGSFSDRAPSIAGSISFARGDGELPLPKSFNGAILVPKVPEPGECWLRVSTASRSRNASSTTRSRDQRSFSSVQDRSPDARGYRSQASLIRRRDDEFAA